MILERAASCHGAATRTLDRGGDAHARWGRAYRAARQVATLPNGWPPRAAVDDREVTVLDVEVYAEGRSCAGAGAPSHSAADVEVLYV